MRFHLQIADQLPSTSDHCIARARSGEPDGYAIMARHQTAGRGSRGRSWLSPHDSLALSALLRPPIAARDAGQWSLLASIAVIDALAALTHTHSRLRLKWPNDVLLDGAKLAGILIDSAAAPDGRLDWLVIGIGANLDTAPTLPDRPTAALAALAPPPTQDQAAHAILHQLDHWATLHHTHGTPAIHAAWLARAHPIGTPLTVSTGAPI